MPESVHLAERVSLTEATRPASPTVPRRLLEGKWLGSSGYYSRKVLERTAITPRPGCQCIQEWRSWYLLPLGNLTYGPPVSQRGYLADAR